MLGYDLVKGRLKSDGFGESGFDDILNHNLLY